MPRKDASSVPISAQAQQDQMSEGIENFELPRSIVTKIAKSALPENAKLQKETVLALVKGSTVFINYLAHDIATSRQHKSISASDIYNALDMIEFNHLKPMLEEQHKAWLQLPKSEKGKKTNSASASSSRNTAAAAPKTTNGTITKTPNGNPYPNISKHSNPYPSVAPDHPLSNNDSPFTNEPLATSSTVAGNPIPMDVDVDGDQID